MIVNQMCPAGRKKRTKALEAEKTEEPSANIVFMLQTFDWMVPLKSKITKASWSVAIVNNIY